LAADYKTRCAEAAEDVDDLIQDHTGELTTLGGRLDDLHDQAQWWLADNAPHLGDCRRWRSACCRPRR
jgi:hypothetical protein